MPGSSTISSACSYNRTDSQHTCDNRDFYGRPYRDLFNLMYKGRSRQQEGITGVSGVSGFVLV